MRNNIFKCLLVATAVTLSGAFTSCDEDAIDDLQGIYQAPTDLTISSATVVDKVKEGNLRTFTVQFNTAEGVSLNMVLVSNQYYLSSTSYTAAAGTAKNGNYISGSTINGSAVVDGSLSLTQNGDDYSIAKSVLFTADGKAYRMKGNVTLPFEVDDPTPVNTVKSITNNGDGTVTVVFTTGGYTAAQSTTTWMFEYAGEGIDWQVTFILPDGKLNPGTYSPNTGYVVGYETGYESYGWFAGTSWGVIEKGAKNMNYITSGDIVVKKDGPLYTILLDQGKGGIYAQFQGSIGDLDPDGGGNVSVMSTLLGVTNWASFGWGVNFIDITLGDGNVTASYDAATQSTTYSGSGLLLNIEPFSSDGTLARGEYTIAADGAAGVCIAGCDNAWSPGNPSGTYYREVKDGVLGAAVYITSGTLTIEGEGDDTKITLKTDDTTYMFSGNLGI